MVATTTSTVGHLRNAVQLIADMPLPDGVGVSVFGHAQINIHPDTPESRRRVMRSPVFRGAAWDVDLDSDLRSSETHRRGLKVVVFRAPVATR